jgi:hypothetical protein
MKKNNKVNPLTYFNNLKDAAVEKAGKDMSTYKKSLTKAQPGIQMGPMTEVQSTLANARSSGDDPMYGGRGPRLYSPRQERTTEANRILKDLGVPTPGYPLPTRAISPQGVYEEYRAVQKSKSKKGGSVKRKRK